MRVRMPKTEVTIKLSDEQFDWLNYAAERLGISRTAVLKRALELHRWWLTDGRRRFPKERNDG